jgi:hypothetical protein
LKKTEKNFEEMNYPVTDAGLNLIVIGEKAEVFFNERSAESRNE